MSALAPTPTPTDALADTPLYRPVSALTAFCKGQAKYAQECYLASVWNEQGKEKQIEKTLNPKKLK